MPRPGIAFQGMAQTDLARFSRLTTHARKLLVVDFGFLGDSVQLVPILWDLKRHRPNAELHVLTTRVGGEVLHMAPCVDRVWSLELMPDRRTLREQLTVLRGLRKERFDAAFNFSGADRTLFWTRLSGARHRATHTWGKPHFWTRWLIPYVVPQQDPNQPIAVQRQRVLNVLGFETTDLRYDLDPGAVATQWASANVPEGSIHLSINAAKPLKEWPLAHSIELTRQILAEKPDASIVASGSARAREQERLRRLAEQVGHSRLTLLPEQATLPRLAAVLQRCRLHIGPDSGVMNLAAALGVPTISFFRAQPGYQAWVPVGERHHTFIAPCHCVDHEHAPCATTGIAACLASVSVVQTLEAVRRALR